LLYFKDIDSVSPRISWFPPIPDTLGRSVSVEKGILFSLTKYISIRLSWDPESISIFAFVETLETVRLNSNIGRLVFGWSEILGLKVGSLTIFVTWELLPLFLYLFLRGHLSNWCWLDPQYKQRFSLLLLSFSSLERGPRGLKFDLGLFVNDLLFLLLLLLLLFGLFCWLLRNCRLVKRRLSILEAMVCMDRSVKLCLTIRNKNLKLIIQ